jgi:hypothetical protein
MTSASPPSLPPWRSRRSWRSGSALTVVAGALVTAAVLTTRRRRRPRPRRSAGTPLDHQGTQRFHGTVASPPPSPPQPDDPDEELRSEDPPPEAPARSLGGAAVGRVDHQDGVHHEAAQHEAAMPRLDPEDPRSRWPPRRWALPSLTVAAALVVVTVSLVVRAVVADSEPQTTTGSREEAGGVTTSTTAATSVPTSTLPPPDPADAFAQASRRLDSAGSFFYSGTAQATDVSHVRPGPWLAPNVTVEGEVELESNRVREVVTTSGGVAEIVADGSTVWARSANTADLLPEASYEIVVGISNESVDRMGAALLPRWLASAIEPQPTEGDAGDGYSFSATIPADDFGEIVRGEGPMAADVVLTLDAAGDPRSIEITSVPRGSLHLVLGITGIGEDVHIDPPEG